MRPVKLAFCLDDHVLIMFTPASQDTALCKKGVIWIQLQEYTVMTQVLGLYDTVQAIFPIAGASTLIVT